MQALKKTIILATAALMLAGCGASPVPSAVARPSSTKKNLPAVGGSSTYVAAGVAQPTKATTPASEKAYTAGTNSAAGPSQGASATASGELVAEIVAEKNGTLLGMGTYRCSVKVSNPTGSQLSGVVTVTFMNGEKESKTAPMERPVVVPANGSITIDFEDKAWSTDSAEVDVTTDAAPPAGLRAAIVKTKNGVVLGMGKFTATVEVSNPTSARKSGIVVVHFLNKGEEVEGGQASQPITLAPGESETIELSNSKWAIDSAEVELKNDASNE